MESHPIGIRSLAVSFPSIIRTNEHWYKIVPELADQVQSKRVRSSRISSHFASNDELDIWSQEVAPYLSDPFRGNVERRVLGQDESSLMLECRAAQDALEAANLHPEQVDLVIVSSLFSEPFGNAPYLAQKLELSCPAWNLESTCSSGLVALQTANSLVRSGDYRHVLVVVSQIGSRTVEETDTLAWSMGDGAGAFVISSLNPNQGILSTKVISTTATCGTYSHELVTDAQGVPRMRTRIGENASLLAETAVEFVRLCSEGAAVKAGVDLSQIDFFAFNTPTAWYASVCARALGIDPERTINLYPRYANIGPVLAIANLYHAAQSSQLREDDLVLVYTNGAGATAGATVMRWGNVGLGAAPAPPIRVTPEQERVQFAAQSPANLSAVGQAAISAELPLEMATLSRKKLLAISPAQRQQAVEDYLLRWLTCALQLLPEQLTPQQPLASILDSLMALTFKSRIEADLQIQVSMPQFFSEKTIAQLAEVLLNQLAIANLAASELDSTINAHEAEREKLSL
ncbi:MAG: 3-oxoacyl-ACP synthase [Aphanocapsa sp. GSE-SYN-MK-11-07L]|jgi:3-oxoacyl-[acyl-carrier-protein] synthase III/acyl carrier protein|nr:3-oxoacyl-ACP synthase [Aphanocapsa sp. GSE-SYN-MK-11-07L]